MSRVAVKTFGSVLDLGDWIVEELHDEEAGSGIRQVALAFLDGVWQASYITNNQQEEQA